VVTIVGAVQPGSSRRDHTVGVVLVDSPNVVRAALGMLVQAQGDMELLIEARTADECLTDLKSLRRRSDVVVVVGLELGGEHDSFWLIRSIREQFPTIPIIASGVASDDATISRALFVGADSFVDKETEPIQFCDAIRRTGRGEVVLEGVPGASLGRIVEGLKHAPAEPVLTSREMEILEAASLGLTARQIGSRLGVRERTVTTHLGRIYKKLGAPGRIAAIAAASRSGLMARHRA
jgi:DNA-binding NarL/FixJ family response regulator